LNNRNILEQFPESLVKEVYKTLAEHNCALKIVNPRKTKRGDFRVLRRGYKITVNRDVNSYRFLFTLIHEIAHLHTYVKYGKRVKPHGKEWKKTFADLMINWGVLELYANDKKLYAAVSEELKNPKACSGVGTELERALKQYDLSNGVLLDELSLDTTFEFRGVHYIKLQKRRTRALCLRLDNNKRYTISLASEVWPK
jgi:SprT protein